MADQLIPIRNDLATYSFQIELEGVLYRLGFRWNQRADRYFMDIFDEQDDLVVGGKKVLINLDLFGRYKDERLPPGRFIALDISGQSQQPGRAVFSNDVKLIYRESTG